MRIRCTLQKRPRVVLVVSVNLEDLVLCHLPALVVVALDPCPFLLQGRVTVRGANRLDLRRKRCLSLDLSRLSTLDKLVTWISGLLLIFLVATCDILSDPKKIRDSVLEISNAATKLKKYKNVNKKEQNIFQCNFFLFIYLFIYLFILFMLASGTATSHLSERAYKRYLKKKKIKEKIKRQ